MPGALLGVSWSVFGTHLGSTWRSRPDLKADPKVKSMPCTWGPLGGVLGHLGDVSGPLGGPDPTRAHFFKKSDPPLGRYRALALIRDVVIKVLGRSPPGGPKGGPRGHICICIYRKRGNYIDIF